MKYPHIYQMLRRAGHSGATTIEIILDAKRGDKWAIQWTRAMCKDAIRWAEKIHPHPPTECVRGERELKRCKT